MSRLRPPLEDLLAEVPSYVVPDPRAAWSAGARRRARRRVGAVGLVTVLVALAGLGFTSLPRAVTGAPVDRPGDGVSGHPTRIDHAWWVRDLTRPGPQAGLVEDDGHDWYVVSPTGRLSRLPGFAGTADGVPALSDDGRRVGYLLETGPDSSTYVIRDLVDAAVTRFPEVGDGRIPSDQTWSAGAQQPAFWAPDGRSVLVRGGRTGARDETDALVLGIDGSVREVVLPASPSPVGWLPDGSLVWLRWRDSGQGLIRSAGLLVTSVDGAVERRVRLPRVGKLTAFDQWTGRVSPDGRRLVVVEHGDGDGGVARVRLFSMASGTLESTSPRMPDVVDSCQPTWVGDQVVVPTYAGSTEPRGVVLRSGATGEPLVVADPRLGLTCSLWAGDALAGTAHHGLVGDLFGMRTSWWTWWWREGVAAAVLLSTGLVGAWLVRRRRRRSRLTRE